MKCPGQRSRRGEPARHWSLLNSTAHEHRATRHNRERRNHAPQERAQPMLHSFSQAIGSRQEPRNVMAESSSDVKVPTARFGRRRDAHVPGAHKVSERRMHGLLDRDGDRRLGDIPNFNVNCIDDEHRPQRCKGGTVSSSSQTGGLDEKGRSLGH